MDFSLISKIAASIIGDNGEFNIFTGEYVVIAETWSGNTLLIKYTRDDVQGATLVRI